jgi:hydrogenase expression/formation protein HypC
MAAMGDLVSGDIAFVGEGFMCLAVPGKIVSVTGSDVLRSANVSFGGTCRQVSLAFVPEAQTDDYVMVHVGFALSVVDETEAKRTLEYLRQMGELAEMSEPA